MGLICCCDIGGSHIRSASFSGGALGPVLRRPTPLNDRAAFLEALRGALSEAPGATALALSICGVVDPASGRLKVANIPCLDGRLLADDLAQALGLPVHIANDADCFAVAEALFGAGRGAGVVFGAILGTGVGGGLVVDGRLVKGAGGYAGEWGHAPVLPLWHGTPPRAQPRVVCGCGQTGCLDTLGGARGLERLHRHVTGSEATSLEIVSRWQAGAPDAAETVALWVDLVAPVLALTVNITGAEVVPLGGGLARSTALVALLDRAVRARILRATDAPLLRPATSGPEPGLLGAALVASAP